MLGLTSNLVALVRGIVVAGVDAGLGRRFGTLVVEASVSGLVERTAP